MIVYGRFDEEKKTLEVKSEGSWSSWAWEVFCTARNKTEARKKFFNDYVKKGRITSPAIFE